MRKLSVWALVEEGNNKRTHSPDTEHMDLDTLVCVCVCVCVCVHASHYLAARRLCGLDVVWINSVCVCVFVNNSY